MTVLLADDRDSNRADWALLKELLSPMGFQIVEAVDGVDALKKTGEIRPDLILPALMMQKMDGLEGLRQIRDSPELRDIIVLAVSASAFEETRQKNLEAGCDAFLSKPLTLKELLGKLHSLLKPTWKYEAPSVPEIRPFRGEHESYKLPEQRELRDSSPHTMSFLLEIQRMAQGFQMKQMCAFLQHYATKG